MPPFHSRAVEQNRGVSRRGLSATPRKTCHGCPAFDGRLKKTRVPRDRLCYEGAHEKSDRGDVVGGFACPPARGWVGGAPKTEDDKTLYALGMIIGRNLSDFNLTPRELDIVKAGMTDTVQKKKHVVEIEIYGPKVDKLHQDRRAARGAAEKKQGTGGRRRRRARAGRGEDGLGRDRADHQAGAEPARRRSRRTR